ncbi:MAG: isoprenylcysteine carboxylmethyltransferase family protein [Gelidibacter sp.]
MKVFIPGLCIAIVGQLIRMVTIGMEYIVRGGKNRRIYADGLVTDGMFSHCRNPMYVGNIMLVIGMSILSNNIMAVIVMIPFFIFIYQAIVRAEEAFLRDKFGAGFDTYCANVNRWMPHLNGISQTFRNSNFSIKKVMFKEYGTTFLWTLGATLLFVYNTYWFATDFTFERHLVGPVITLALLLTFYLTTRYLKKSERRRKRTVNS